MKKKPRFKTFVKATDKMSGPPQPSLNWALSQRCQMEIFDDHISIGPWTLKTAEITGATMYQTPGRWPARLLELRTERFTVQVNFNPGTDPTPHLDFEIDRQPTPAWMARARLIVYGVVGATLLFTLVVFLLDL